MTLQSLEYMNPRVEVRDAGRVSLPAALGAEAGVVCFVGAGGKKSAMYHVARQHPGRVGLTSTVHMHPYDEGVVGGVLSLAEGDFHRRLDDAARERVLAFINPSRKPNRHGGLSGDEVLTLHDSAGVDVLLVKADGARGRLIKAPAPHEPVLPDHFATLVPVVSIRAVGRRLDHVIAHRPELVADRTGATVGGFVEPVHLARLLADADGGCRHAERAGTLVALINMVDTPTQHDLALEVATRALALTDRITRVVLASMAHGTVVEIIEP